MDLRIPLYWKHDEEKVLDFLLSKYHSGLNSSEICAAIVHFQEEHSRPPSDEELMALCVEDKRLRLGALVFRAQHLLQSGVPRDCLIRSLGLDKLSLRSAVLADLKAGMKAFQEWITRAGIFSLSEAPDHPLMWAHYGENYRGICLGITNALMSYRRQYLAPVPVTYVSQPPKIDPAMLFSKEPNVYWEVNRTLLCTKSEHWAYEREWRFIVNEGDKAYSIPGELSEVIFGSSCPPDTRDEIIRLCTKRFSPRFFEVQLGGDSWQPVIVPVEM